VAGKVILAGAPFPKATVRLGLESFGETTQPIAEVASSADGSFDFGQQPPVTFSVSAEAPGHLATSTIIAVGDPRSKPDQILLELGDCASRLYGSVIDSSGGTIAYARLRIAGLGGADADANGKYSLCVRPGDTNVRVEADGYATVDFRVHLYNGALRHNFELVPESFAAGIVVDETGQPVANAHVVAIPDPSERPHHVADGSATTNSAGRFRITGLAPAKYLLVAYGDGIATRSPHLALATAAGGHEVRIVVARAVRITGLVVMGGKPVGGARVGIATKPPIAGPESYSQPDGKFVLDGVPVGTVSFVAPPYEVKSPRSLKVERSIDNLTLEVAAMASLHGHVTRHKQPVPGAEVSCGYGNPPLAKSEPDGAYLLEGLRPGPCPLVAFENLHARAFTSKPQMLALAAGESREADLDLDGSGEIRGVVVDESGKPVPSVYVFANFAAIGDSGESMTNERGEFDCEFLAGGGDYTMSVFPSPAGGRPFAPAAGDHFDPVHVANGEDVVTGVRLAIKHEILSIRGRVIDDTGAPVSDVHVEALGGFAPMIASVRADASGAFEIGNLARGIYSVHAHAGDGSEAEVPNIAAGTSGVEIRLIRPGSIEGQLVGFSTEPVVHAVTLSNKLFLGTDAIVEGDHFSITGLTPATYAVDARAGDEVDGASVEVRSGTVAHVTLKSRGRTGKVQGRVTEFTSKAPIAGMLCTATVSIGGVAGTPDPNGSPATTDAQGNFAVDSPVGRVRVFCFGPTMPYSVAGGDFDVTLGSPTRADLAAVKMAPPPCDPGFQITPITLPLVIRSIEPDGPAAKSGLAVGDHVVAIDGASVAGLLPNGAMMLAWNHRPGTTLLVSVERAGATQTFKIVVANAPQ
jgi:protocatechuate 3,4-dioxygenase beta subunit